MGKRRLLLAVSLLLIVILAVIIFVPLKTISFKNTADPVCIDLTGNPAQLNAVKRFSVLRGRSGDYDTAAKQLKTTNTPTYTQAYNLFCQSQGSDTQYKLYLY